MESRFKIDVMVGGFVFGSIVIFCIFLLTVSDTAGLFVSKAIIKTSYANAAVKEGTPVRFQGTRAGTVIKVELSAPLKPGTTGEDALEKSKAIVTMEVTASILNNIGKNAEAQITTEGMLGDNLIYITRGTPEIPSVGHLNDGDFIHGVEGAGMLDGLAPVADTLNEILEDIQRDNLASIEDKKTEIGVMLGSMANITQDIDNGTGTLGALINDPAGAQVAANLEKTTAGLGDLMDEIAHGDGSMHQLLYGPNLDKTVANAGELMGNMAKITGDLEERDIDKEIKEILVNIEGMTKSLDSVLKKIDGGEGTAGALINDRKMYEDISSLLQGAERSAIVRTAVRHVWTEKLKDAEKERVRRAEEIKSRQ